MNRLLTTEQASAAVGLSAWELRRGFKAGDYPAIQIGRGDRARRLRWDLDALEMSIRQRMVDRIGEGVQ